MHEYVKYYNETRIMMKLKPSSINYRNKVLKRTTRTEGLKITPIFRSRFSLKASRSLEFLVLFLGVSVYGRFCIPLLITGIYL